VVVATAGAVGTQLWEAEGTDLAAEAAEASAEVGASAAVDSVAEVASVEVAAVSAEVGADSVAAVSEAVDFAVDSAEASTAVASMGSDFMIRSFLVTTDMDTAIPITIHMPTIRTATRLTGMDITGPQLEL
jgi:hypothetical protein